MTTAYFVGYSIEQAFRKSDGSSYEARYAYLLFSHTREGAKGFYCAKDFYRGDPEDLRLTPIGTKVDCVYSRYGLESLTPVA